MVIAILIDKSWLENQSCTHSSSFDFFESVFGRRPERAKSSFEAAWRLFEKGSFLSFSYIPDPFFPSKSYFS
jgi:hypothetical protein